MRSSIVASDEPPQSGTAARGTTLADEQGRKAPTRPRRAGRRPGSAERARGPVYRDAPAWREKPRVPAGCSEQAMAWEIPQRLLARLAGRCQRPRARQCAGFRDRLRNGFSQKPRRPSFSVRGRCRIVAVRRHQTGEPSACLAGLARERRSADPATGGGYSRGEPPGGRSAETPGWPANSRSFACTLPTFCGPIRRSCFCGGARASRRTSAKS